MTRTTIGIMTGTSIDAIDAALVEISGRGLDLRAEVGATASRPLGGLGVTLRRIAEQEPVDSGEIARARRALGEACASCAHDLGAERIDLVSVHGQTVYHSPPVSWQLIDAAPIAAALGAPVLFDLRGPDLNAGGRGAPITPLADWVMLRDPGESRAIVNLGGFCNVTLLPAGAGVDAVRGFDVCACNQVLDACARLGLGAGFDAGGSSALAGEPQVHALAELCSILEAQREEGRSLGTGDEAMNWAERWAPSLHAQDLCRSACEAIGASIGASLGEVDRVLLAGGGVQNAALVDCIRRATESGDGADPLISPTDDCSVPAAYREAAAFAVLGALAQDRVALTLPQVTGRGDDVMLGGTWALP